MVNTEYLLEKYPGKGGWTYVVIPEVLQDQNKPFGWVRVRGSIDHFEIKSYRLMPMGNGKLFLPVKAAIRKEIGKQEGDIVRVILYADEMPLDIPEELRVCLSDEPGALETFLSYPEGDQKAFIEWIYSARTDETKVERIAKTLDKIARHQKFYEQENRN